MQTALINPMSEYRVKGICLTRQITDQALKQCLESPRPFVASNNRECIIRIRTNVVVLFRTMVFFANFSNCIDKFWQAVSEVMGWDARIYSQIAGMYVGGPEEYLRGSQAQAQMGSKMTEYG
jgi:hypothetical protein